MKWSMLALLAPAALVAFSLGAPLSPAAAAPITVTTANDNFIDGQNSNVVQSGNVMRVRSNSGAGFSFKAYIQFDLSSYDTDLLDGNSPATLVFYRDPNVLGTLSPVPNQRVWVLNANASGYNWSSAAITWNNAPANSTGSGYLFNSDATQVSFTRPDNATPTTSFSYHPTNAGEGGEFYTLQMTDWKNYLQPNKTITFMLGPTWTGSSGPSAFFTRNVSTFSVESIPEPTGGLLALGGLALIPALRRRRHAI